MKVYGTLVVLIILLIATIYNSLFYWRRYPALLMRYSAKENNLNKPSTEGLGRHQIDSALQKMNQYIDVSHEDLEKIFQLARKQTGSQLRINQLKLGHYYSNGEIDDNWSVRQIIDEADDQYTDEELIIYKIVAGKGISETSTIRRNDFSQWAKYEVYRNERSWERIPSSVITDVQYSKEEGVNESTY
jgi:CBS domain-containing membrane protein